MTKEEFVDTVAPKSAMSQDEMVKVVSKESAFLEASQNDK